MESKGGEQIRVFNQNTIAKKYYTISTTYLEAKLNSPVRMVYTSAGKDFMMSLNLSKYEGGNKWKWK